MSLDITQLRVFVSCAGDVIAEKKIVKDVCERINAILSQENYSVNLQVRDWKDIIGPFGDRPQGVINAAFQGNDIYLGILWMRFGTPPNAKNNDTGLDFQSGTEEEFYLAYEKWQLSNESIKIYLFFKEAIAPKNVNEAKQLTKVLKFKEKVTLLGWVNPFKTKTEFNNLMYSLLYPAAVKIHFEKLLKIKNDTLKVKVSSKTEQKAKIDFNVYFNHFTKDIDSIGYYIPRTIRPISYSNEKINFFIDTSESKTLYDLIFKTNKIILLASAGTGKSIELQNLVSKFSKTDTPYIPIYKRFNVYVDESIEDFLPNEWMEVNEEILLLVFDGLDEIQPQYFNNAIRKVQGFSETHPLIKIVISCRINFYELPTENVSGTLTGFECYFLNDISRDEVEIYLSTRFNIDTKSFMKEANKENYQDLMVNPFFLKILVPHFINHGNLKYKRADMIFEFISSRFNYDENHFKDNKHNKNEILKLFQKVALCMEIMGRNYVTNEELLKIIDIQSNFNFLKYFTAFNKTQTNNWQFEHNNIQEYLAASALIPKSLEQIKQVVSFMPSFNKIKPTWVNTLSFYISIAQEDKVSAIVDWLSSIEPKILIKFEKERIKNDLRISLFKQIFEDYKEKNIWLSSNNFTDSELARFSQSEEVVDYLIQELENNQNTRIVKLNALYILDNVDFALISSSYLFKLKNVLFAILDSAENDSSLIHSILHAMGDLGMNDEETLNRIIGKFQKRNNQWIRAGLYDMINKSEFLDNHIDVYLKGIEIADNEKQIEDREEINLADESISLEKGLSKATTPEAIKKILLFLKSSEIRTYRISHDKKRAFEKIIKNATNAYFYDVSIYDIIYEIFVLLGKSYHLNYATQLLPFFEKTETKIKTFESLWKTTELPSYEKGMLIALLTDRHTIDFFVVKFKERDFNKSEANTFYKELLWDISRSKNDPSLITYLEQQLISEANFYVEKQPYVDFEANKLKKDQFSFDIIFDKLSMISEIENFFTKFNLNEFGYEKFWETRKENIHLIYESFAEAMIDLLGYIVKNTTVEKLDDLKQLVLDNHEYVNWQIHNIYNYIKNNLKLNLSNNQLLFINGWCLVLAARLTNKDYINNSINKKTIKILWFFVNRIKNDLSQNQLLEFTKYDIFEKHNEDKLYVEINQLKAFIDIVSINNQIRKNLRVGINDMDVWKNNVLYAIDNNLNDVYPIIVQDLKKYTKLEYQKINVLEAYFNKAQNFSALQEILGVVGLDSLGWKIVTLLLDYEHQHIFLSIYLKQIINDDLQILDNRLRAAGFLIRINEITGLVFYANYLIEKDNPLIDYHGQSNFSKLVITEAIPQLLKLLFLAKKSPYNTDFLNHLESDVLSAFYNIAQFSETNMLMVKDELELFIKENSEIIPNVKFLHLSIDRMESQYYMNKSTSITIEDAISEISSIGV